MIAYLRGGEDAEHRGVQQVQAVGQAAVHSPHRVLKQLHTGTDTQRVEGHQHDSHNSVHQEKSVSLP